MAHLNSAASTFFFLELDADEASASPWPALEVLASLVPNAPSQLLEDASDARASTLNDAGEVDLHAFAEALAGRGHQIWLRTGRHDKCNQVSLRHTFVIASGDTSSIGDPEPALFVVDPSFKDSFMLCNPTPAYQALWEALPPLFVGTAQQLVPLVEFLCTQIQIVFAETASSCPPWRQPSFMITKWLPSSADDVDISATGTSSMVSGEVATQQQQAACNRSPAELSRSSSATSSGSCSGLRTLSSCYAAIISTAAASANPAVAAAAAAADGVYTPRAGRAHGYDRSDSSNILLSGSLEDLGAAAGPLDFAAAGFAGTGVAADDQGCWGATCIVQAGSLSPGCTAGKLSCFGTSWGHVSCGDGDEDGYGGGSSCEYGRSFICLDVGGVAIKVADAAKVAAGAGYAGPACKDYRIPVGRNPPSLTPQHSEASTAATCGASSAAVTPRAAAGGGTRAALDMTRFNSEIDDLNAFMAGPRGRDLGMPVQRSVSETCVPAKRPAGNHLLRQCSALSAAIAGSARKL